MDATPPLTTPPEPPATALPSIVPNVPKDLSNLTGWEKVFRLGFGLAVVVVGGVAWVAGKSFQAAGAAGAAVSAMIAVALLSRYIRRAVAVADGLLLVPGLAPPRKEAARVLRSHIGRTLTALVGLAGLGAGLIAWEALPPLHDALTMKRPEIIRFDSLKYFTGKASDHAPHNAPFFDAVIATLASEGESSGAKYQIVMGGTEPLAASSPGFRCVFASTGDAPLQFVVTGFAFRLRDIDGRPAYEPLDVVRIPKLETPGFRVGRCQAGDRLYIIAKITVAGDGEFPADLNAAVRLDVLTEK